MAVLLACPLLTSCAPPDAGATGMTLDAQGRPTAVVAWCPGKAPDTIIIAAVDDDSEPRIVLEAPGKFPGRTIQVPITDPPAGWRVTPPSPSLKPHLVYHAYAPVTGSDYTARGPRFSLARLRGNGQILRQRYDEKTDRDVDIYIGMDELVRTANDYC
ncbi:hypothetical protein Acsp03_49240 [Actinomadura sp. NBRC 104412]|uniref:hypothetical protein n=1 Tax=Actinomadura sp. NBRC 104412 TaxID=3032203 RepID=UPI0024A3E4B2|nr:hypothetical protein [Actinomadura sp. NBRC 104412]GLZ07458.1 hypothetical protein Acsp03_49240 [Actinomadura sp. NBRC 104412]